MVQREASAESRPTNLRELRSQARRIGQILQTKLTSLAPVLSGLVLSSGRLALAGYGRTRSYRHLPVDFDVWLDAAVACGRDSERSLLEDLTLRAVLMLLIETTTDDDLPPSLRDPLAVEFQRIISFCGGANGQLARSDDQSLKDLAVCTGKLVAAGAQLVESNIKLSRRVLIQGDLRQSVSYARLLAGSRGASGFFEIHTSNACLHEFNEAGWHRCYLRVADLLRAQPEVCGVIGSSWFFDTQLAVISPRLSYLRQLPTLGGANFFSLGTDAASVVDATATSQTRRELHRAGSYVPTRWLMVWRREELLTWADSAGPSLGALR